jgi:hypothetical protein
VASVSAVKRAAAQDNSSVPEKGPGSYQLVAEDIKGLGWDYWDKKTRCESTWAYNDFVHEQLEDGNSYVYEGTVLYSNVSDLVGLMANTTADCLKYKVYDGNDYSHIYADYLTALITSLVLLLTGENLEPVTELEKVTMLVMLIIGVFTISIVFGGVHSVVSSLQARTTAYQLKMESIHDAMDRMNLPESLSERIFYYYDYIHMEHGTLDGNVVGFLPEVTKKLQAEIYLWQRYQLVVGVPFFKNINSRVRPPRASERSERQHERAAAAHQRPTPTRAGGADGRAND